MSSSLGFFLLCLLSKLTVAYSVVALNTQYATSGISSAAVAREGMNYFLILFSDSILLLLWIASQGCYYTDTYTSGPESGQMCLATQFVLTTYLPLQRTCCLRATGLHVGFRRSKCQPPVPDLCTGLQYLGPILKTVPLIMCPIWSGGVLIISCCSKKSAQHLAASWEFVTSLRNPNFSHAKPQLRQWRSEKTHVKGAARANRAYVRQKIVIYRFMQPFPKKVKSVTHIFYKKRWFD